MKKVFELDEVDCANCARKMQEAVAKIDGVDNVTVNFFTQKMTLEAADDKFDDVLTEALRNGPPAEDISGMVRDLDEQYAHTIEVIKSYSANPEV